MPTVLTEAHYGAVLNFFYFLLLDEGLALNAAYKATKIAQKKLVEIEPAQADRVLISVMSGLFHKYKKHHRTLHSVLQPPKSDWKTPNRDYLGAWKEYMRRSTDDSPETLVLHYVLNYPISTISKGLEIPEGTLYFRIGRGLENFSHGSFLQSAPTGAKK